MGYKKIQDIEVEVIDGDRGKNYPNGDDFKKEKYCLFLNAKNVTVNGFDFSEKMFIDKEKDNVLKKGKLKRDDIVLTTRGTVGNVALYSNDIMFENMRINSGMVILRCDNKNIYSKYLYYVLKSKEIQDKIRQIKTGSAQPQLPISILKEIEIRLVNYNTQKKIVRILEQLEKKIELNKQINDNLQELINNVYIKYFVDFDEYCGEYKESDLGVIPDSFEVDTLGNVITFSNGYGWNSKDMSDNSIEDSYKVFKMANINIGGGINKAKTKSWIKKDKANNLEQYISKKGDILMCMTDMKNSGNPLLGHTALIDKDDEFLINQRVGIIKCNKKLGYAYIYTMSNLKHFINDIRSRANSGVQVNLTTKGICDTLVLVPDDNTLNKFQKVAELLYEKIFINNNENEILEHLRDTLLPKLMNGEIDLDKIEI